MALPPDPKKEAETGLKTGAGAVASVLKGVFDAAVSAMTKILPGTASTSSTDDSETPPVPPSESNPPPTQLNINIFKEAEEIAKDREKEIPERPAAVIPSNKGAEQSSDAEEKLAADLFAKQINKINQLPPTDVPRSKPPAKPRPYPNK